MLSRAPVSVTLPFQGLAKAAPFYEGLLGLERIGGSPEEGWLEFEAGDGTTLDVFESDSPKSGDTAATFQVDDLAAEMAELRKKGVRFEDYDLPDVKTVNGVATMDGMKAAWFKDPGGNVLGLAQDGK
jgi:catechol 2,3-dioxygenase-like lactoylglutathione lyase family enzyme